MRAYLKDLNNYAPNNCIAAVEILQMFDAGHVLLCDYSINHWLIYPYDGAGS